MALETIIQQQIKLAKLQGKEITTLSLPHSCNVTDIISLVEEAGAEIISTDKMFGRLFIDVRIN